MQAAARALIWLVVCNCMTSASRRRLLSAGVCCILVCDGLQRPCNLLGLGRCGSLILPIACWEVAAITGRRMNPDRPRHI
jgi:hypothetical protein